MERCTERLAHAYQQLPDTPPLSRSPSPGHARAEGNVSLAQPRSYAEAKATPTHSPVTFNVFPRKNGRTLTVHLLSQTSRHVIAQRAREYALSGALATQQKLDEDIKCKSLRIPAADTAATLSFESDPDLLIVHRLHPPSFLRALLPRSPPELGGYPFWPLRITEI